MSDAIPPPVITQHSFPEPQLVAVHVSPPSPIPPLLLPLLLPAPLLLPLLELEVASMLPLLLPVPLLLPLPPSPSLPLPLLLVLPPHAAATADTVAPTIKSIFMLRM